MDNKIISVCLFVALFYAANAVPWKDCGSLGSKVKNVAVSGCESENTCNLPKGHNVTFTVSFNTTEKFNKATAVVHGIIAQIPVPFPIGHPDGCTESGLTCPVNPYTDCVYKQTIFVEQSYPKMQLIVKWELKKEKSTDCFCIELPVAIVDDGSKKRGENDVL